MHAVEAAQMAVNSILGTTFEENGRIVQARPGAGQLFLPGLTGWQRNVVSLFNVSTIISEKLQCTLSQSFKRRHLLSRLV